MAPQATSVACVHPSNALQDEKTDTEENKKNDNENLQGRLLRQNPSRAMTPQATSAACVSPWQGPSARPGTVLDSPDDLPGRPWQRHEHAGALGRRQCPSGETTAVAGTYAAKIALAPTTRGSRTTGTVSNSFFQESTRGSSGKLGCSRVRRHALTVAFELLRWHHTQRCPCPPSWSGHACRRQEVRAHPPE